MPRATGRTRSTPSGDERRSARRVGSRGSARILDISPGGIRLETSAPLEKGSVYDLILQLGDRRMPVAARVVRARRQASATDASLTFERFLGTDREYLEQTLVREVADRMTVIVR